MDIVAARLFDLHVARYAMQPDGVVADQALELVQMSSDTRTVIIQRVTQRRKTSKTAGAAPAPAGPAAAGAERGRRPVRKTSSSTRRPCAAHASELADRLQHRQPGPFG